MCRTNGSASGRTAASTARKGMTASIPVSTIPKHAGCWSSLKRREMNQIAKQMTTEAFKDKRLNDLNSWQETFFHRILIACDDDGRLNADPSFIKTALFPLKTDLRVSQVANALTTLNSVGLITLEKDNQGHPTSLTVSRDLTTRTHEREIFPADGRRGGAGGTTGRYLNINKLNDEGNEGYETRKDELGDKPSWENEDADNLDVTQEEAETYRRNWQAIEDQARKFGLSTSTGALEMAAELANEYSLDWVLKAIAECVDVPYWRYVKAVLKASKERDSAPGVAKKKSSKKSAREAMNSGDIHYDGPNIAQWWGGLGVDE